jgi:hypothetical protein
MNRRTFVKAILATPLAPLLPSALVVPSVAAVTAQATASGEWTSYSLSCSASASHAPDEDDD